MTRERWRHIAAVLTMALFLVVALGGDFTLSETAALLIVGAGCAWVWWFDW